MISKIIGHDAKRYPLALTETSGMIVLTVLVRRTEGTHKAYAAIVPDISTTDPDYDSVKSWVHRNGNALSYGEVNAIWPMPAKDYAR